MNKKNITDNSIFFEKIYKQPDFFNLKYSIPSVVVSEDNTNHYVKIITSETDTKGFTLNIKNKKLIINCRDNSENEGKVYTKYSKSFEKIMEIPEDSDINNMKSKLFNGVFTLTIPKAFCFYD